MRLILIILLFLLTLCKSDPIPKYEIGDTVTVIQGRQYEYEIIGIKWEGQWVYELIYCNKKPLCYTMFTTEENIF